MLDITPDISIGQIITVAITLGGGGLGVWAAYLKFRTKTEVSLAAVETQIADTNKRVSDFAAGASTTKSDLHDFKALVERHYVERDELGHLRASFDDKIDRMQNSLDVAIGTMSDVRDAVIILTSKNSSTTVPPARRRTPKTRS